MSKKQTKYSVTRLELFDRCPLAYKKRYIEKIRLPTVNEALTFGSLTHACLEGCYKAVVEEEIQGKVPDELIQQCCRTASGDTDGADMFASSEAARLTRSYFLDRDEVDCHSVLGIEKRFDMTINGVPVLGFIDLVERKGEDSLIVTDFKTNKRPYDQVELDNSLQAGIYWYAARKMWPWAKKVHFVFDMLKPGVQQSPKDIKELARRCFEYLPLAVQKVEKAIQTGKFPAKLHTFCSWCDYSPTCPAYLHAINNELDVSKAEKAAASGDMATLAKVRDDLSAKRMAADKQLKQVDKLLKTKIKETNAPLIANGSRYTLVTLSPKAFSAADVLKHMEKMGQDTPDHETMVKEFCDLSEYSLKQLFKMYKTDMAARAMVMTLVKSSANRKRSPLTFVASNSAKLDS